MEILKVENLTKVYNSYKGAKEVTALGGINLIIRQGEFVGIMGPSGSGKTTLLNILSGIDKSTSGQVSISNRDISKMKKDELALFRRKNMGFIFQSYNLMPQLTALENVEMPLIFSGISKKERIERAKSMLEKVGLADRMNHKPSELSGGQQQRVSIARALINNPSVILADEPTGNLDSKTTIEILDLLKELNKNFNTTFVVVTHSQVVYEYADRVIKMEDGLLC